MGDFNARPEADEIRFLRGLVTLGMAGEPISRTPGSACTPAILA
jgi:hypothetical protein